MKLTTLVGSAEMDVQWGLEGNGTFVNLWRIKANVDVSKVYFLAALYNGAVLADDGNGSEIGFQMSEHKGTVPAGSLLNCPCKNRAVLRDNDNRDHNSRAEFAVWINGQVGWWYFYAHSPVAWRDGPPNSQATIYRYHPAIDLPQDPIGGGWSS